MPSTGTAQASVSGKKTRKEKKSTAYITMESRTPVRLGRKIAPTHPSQHNRRKG